MNTHAPHHFPRHFAAKSTSKQAIRTINPTSSTVSDGIGHFLGLRSNIFSPSHTENHRTAGTISNNHHKDISTPGFLWSDRTTKRAQFQRFVLRDETAAVASAQPPFLATAATNSVSTGGPARDVETNRWPDMPIHRTRRFVISKFTGGPNLGEAASVFSVTSRGSDAAPILRRVA